MATFAIRPIAPVKAVADEVFYTNPHEPNASFLAGAAVVMTSGGQIAEAGTNPSQILGFATAGVSDYEWKDDTFGFVSPAIPVARADQEFRGTLLGTFAQSDVGAQYGLTRDSSGYWVVDKSKTGANARVLVLGVDHTAIDGVITAGDVNVPVRFVVLAANRQVVA